MKVRVAVTVDVDPAVWAAEYGLDPAEVRADVRAKVQTDLYAQFVDVLGIARDVVAK